MRQVGAGIGIFTGVVAICVVGLLFFLWGGGKILDWLEPDAISNDKVISETKKCEKAGLKASATYWMIDGRITRITCVPKEH